MISQKEIDFYSKKYNKTVCAILDSNSRFYSFNGGIKWCFGWNPDPRIVATCNRDKAIITINIEAFLISLREDNLKTIEYYLLHEIRHIYQHICIHEYTSNKKDEKNEYVEKWIEEEKHYVKSLNANGEENPEYFMQDMEMDAYAYSFAVMKYKYKDSYSPYVPKIYGDQFFQIVNDWMIFFAKNNL